MLKNLEKVSKIWEDVELSYINRDPRFENLNRLDYIKLLVGYKNGTTKISLIKRNLKSEIGTYSQEELTLYSNICIILDALEGNIDSMPEDMDDLDIYMKHLIYQSQSKNSDIKSKVLSSDYFKSLELYTPDNNQNCMNIYSLFKATGCFSDVSMIENGKEAFYTLNDNTFDNTLIFKSEQHFSNFIKYIGTPKDGTFYKKFLKVASGMIKNKTFKLYKIFIGPEDYKLDGNKLYLTKFGDKFISLRGDRSSSINGVDIIKCSFKNYIMKYDIVVIL